MLVRGPYLKELVCVLYLVRPLLIMPPSFVLVAGSGVLGVSIAIIALSDHAECTVWWAFAATIVVAAAASIRTFQSIGWLTWVGFMSLSIAILMVV